MKRLIYIFAATILLSSCSDWFDVKPKQLTEEEDLFSREQGFKEALTGVYMKAAQRSLYGKTLTYDFLDILAQRYYIADGRLQKEEYYDFSTGNTLTSPYTNGIWSAMYSVIANINNMLWWAEERRDVFQTPGLYEAIKGEAIGFRSYLYFDLLRMFGPIYKTDPQAYSILYRTELSREAVPLRRANEMIDIIISDLLKAQTLLEESKTYGNSTRETFLNYSPKRMNKWAIKGLLARAYLYKGDDASLRLARHYADEVIKSGQYRLTSGYKATTISNNEFIFSLHYNNTNTDNPDNLIDSPETYTIQSEYFFGDIFEKGVGLPGNNDLRIREEAFTIVDNAQRTLKYVQTGWTTSFLATLPLIRLPEMYYIMAESYINEDLGRAAYYFNEIRLIRGLDEVESFADADELIYYLETEYRKEFYAEGQMWYFYKRHFFNTFLHCPMDNLEKANYIFSIPDDEITFGGILPE